MHFIDSHSHFGSCIEAGMRIEEIFSMMKTADVKTAVQVSTSGDDMAWSASFAEEHDNIFFTLGVHPEYASRADNGADTIEDLIAGLKPETKNGRLFGIGEIGLDYHWESGNKKEQAFLFEYQINIAQKNGLPVIIHSRDAFDDTVSILKNQKVDHALFHCFGGNAAQAEKILDMGFYISFAGNVTYKNAADLQEAAAFVPDDRLLLETDCPYLAPLPVRGQKNHPGFVPHVYSFAAALRETDVQSLSEKIKMNFEKFSRKKTGAQKADLESS